MNMVHVEDTQIFYETVRSVETTFCEAFSTKIKYKNQQKQFSCTK